MRVFGSNNLFSLSLQNSIVTSEDSPNPHKPIQRRRKRKREVGIANLQRPYKRQKTNVMSSYHNVARDDDVHITKNRDHTVRTRNQKRESSMAFGAASQERNGLRNTSSDSLKSTNRKAIRVNRDAMHFDIKCTVNTGFITSIGQRVKFGSNYVSTDSRSLIIPNVDLRMWTIEQLQSVLALRISGFSEGHWKCLHDGDAIPFQRLKAHSLLSVLTDDYTAEVGDKEQVEEELDIDENGFVCLSLQQRQHGGCTQTNQSEEHQA